MFSAEDFRSYVGDHPVPDETLLEPSVTVRLSVPYYLFSLCFNDNGTVKRFALNNEWKLRQKWVNEYQKHAKQH